MSPLPRARLSAAIISLIATLIMTNGIVLAFTWLCIALPLIIIARILRPHLIFCFMFLLPFGAALFFVWVVIVGAPPNSVLANDVTGAQQYVLRITFRLALITAIIQLCFLTIHPAHLPTTFSRWGLRGDALIISLSALALIPELNRRAAEVLNARYARGYIAKRSLFVRMIQMPFLLRPLFTWALRSAVQRSETWKQRDLLNRLFDISLEETSGSIKGSTFWLLLSMLWLLFVVRVRFLGH